MNCGFAYPVYRIVSFLLEPRPDYGEVHYADCWAAAPYVDRPEVADDVYPVGHVCRDLLDLPDHWRPQAHDASWPMKWYGEAKVIDGDTIEVQGQRIRLWGIDAFEAGQQCRHADGTAWRCGQAATDLVQTLTAAGPVSCRVSGRDRYGRDLATCAVHAQDIGQQVIEAGLALPYWRYTGYYATAETFAQRREVGVWADNWQDIEPPWKWRKSRKN